MRNARLGQATMLMAMFTTAMPAMAGDFSFQLGIGTGHQGQGMAFGLQIGQPRPVVAAQQVWVAPVYQTVTERVWVPTTQTAYRDVPVTDIFGNVISYRREAYTVQSGYWTEVQKQVLVQEGHWAAAPAAVYTPTTALPFRAGLASIAGVRHAPTIRADRYDRGDKDKHDRDDHRTPRKR